MRIFKNVPNGSQSIEYTKDGYSSDTCLVTIPPDEIPVVNSKIIFMAEKPDVKITSMEVSFATDKLIVKGKLPKVYCTMAVLRKNFT